MTSFSKTTIALDVDGVLSPVTGMNTGLPDKAYPGWEYTVLGAKCFGAVVGLPVVALLRELLEKGTTIKWHTSWRENAEYIGEDLGLPHFDQFATEEVYRGVGLPRKKWWKLAGVEAWAGQAADDERLIWLDDDIFDAALNGEIPSEILEDPRITIISPHTYWGLSSSDLERISKAAETGDSFEFVSHGELPESPGSVVTWPELDEYGDPIHYVSTLFQSPDGTTHWGDSFISEGVSSVFKKENIQSQGWIRVIETVPADEAPEAVKEAFANGDVVLGAVFTSELPDGVESTFTTAPGLIYHREISDVVQVDPFGNLYEEGNARTALWLPKVIVY